MRARTDFACLLQILLSTVGCGDGARDGKSPDAGVPGVLGSQLGQGSQSALSPNASALQIDARALKEIVARVPAQLPPTREGGTLIGTEASASPQTSVSPDASTTPPGDQSLIDLRADQKASNAGSEKDLRASLYFQLVDQCRDESAKYLPPEAVEVEFRVDPRGRIDRTSVKAKASAPQFAKAADCMMRVIRTADARFSTERLDEPTRIRARVPSVD